MNDFDIGEAPNTADAAFVSENILNYQESTDESKEIGYIKWWYKKKL